jgi:hypothetical protein
LIDFLSCPCSAVFRLIIYCLGLLDRTAALIKSADRGDLEALIVENTRLLLACHNDEAEAHELAETTRFEIANQFLQNENILKRYATISTSSCVPTLSFSNLSGNFFPTVFTRVNQGHGHEYPERINGVFQVATSLCQGEGARNPFF